MGLTVNIKKNLGEFHLDVQFVSESSRIGILGASGCGKSMTLKSIAGIETPDEGEIIINGKTVYSSQKKINQKPQDRRIGYLFQNYALFPTMTVEKNIATGLRGPKQEKMDRVKEMIRIFRLEGLEKRLPGELSGGQQQRVALARIMAYEPEVILLDEPFSALDSFLRDRLQQDLIEMLNDYRGTVIMVSHNRDEVYRFSDELLIMDSGKAVAYGKTKEIFENPGCTAAARLTGREENADMEDFTHFNDQGKAKMVDVGEKPVSRRTAAAEGFICVSRETFSLIRTGGIKKGDVLTVAQIAGIMGAKKTPELIPMCHPVPLNGINLSFQPDEENLRIRILAETVCDGKTGVEMEALTAVSVAALTIYDMCKAVQKDMEITGIRLLTKTGGVHGEYYRNGRAEITI